MATIEHNYFLHTHKQKVRTKEKRKARGIADNNRISFKNRHIARIRLGKKVTVQYPFLIKVSPPLFVTVQCPFLIKVGCIVLYNSVAFFDHKSLFNSSYGNLNQWLTISCFGKGIWYFAKRINRSKIMSVCTLELL